LSSPEPVVIVASAEFTLKSSPVRRTLEQRLMDDLKVRLTRAGIEGFKIQRDAGRIVIRGTSQNDEAAQNCAKVFGVAYAAPAVVLPASMDTVLATLVTSAREGLGTGQSFAIRTHRSTPSPLSRHEIEIKGGSEVLRDLAQKNVKVNLKNPDVTLYVDLAGDSAYVYRQRFSGPGGLPLSSQWKMLVVLDSGPLSILAAYAMMRRGCLVEPLIPISETIPTFNREQQLRFAQRLRDLVTRPNYRAFSIQLGKEEAISLQYAAARRLVRLLSVKLATEKKFRGLIFADVAGDIAALQNGFSSADRGSPPVFRPLIGLDTEGLIGMCKEVGIPLEELQVQMRLEGPESNVPTFDSSRLLDEAEFEQISL
jgi:thiamine biosynthesis protein ThiI